MICSHSHEDLPKRRVLLGLAVVFLAACSGKSVDVPDTITSFLVQSDPIAKRCYERAYRTNEELTSQLNWAAVQLDEDDELEHFVRAKPGTACFCGNRSCASWVIGKENGTYRSYGGEAGKVLGTSTHGMKDIESEFSVSDGMNMRVVFRFDGTEYRPAKCFTQDQDAEDVSFKESPCP